MELINNFTRDVMISCADDVITMSIEEDDVIIRIVEPCSSLDDDAASATPYSFTAQLSTALVCTTAAAPASEVEAVVRSPTNMAAAKIAAVDFSSKMTSKWRHLTGLLLAAMFVGEDLLANRRLQTLLLF